MLGWIYIAVLVLGIYFVVLGFRELMRIDEKDPPFMKKYRDGIQIGAWTVAAISVFAINSLFNVLGFSIKEAPIWIGAIVTLLVGIPTIIWLSKEIRSDANDPRSLLQEISKPRMAGLMAGLSVGMVLVPSVAVAELV